MPEDRQLIKMGKKYTYLGESIRILCTDGVPPRPVIGLLEDGQILTFNRYGKLGIGPSSIYLQESKEKVWVNIYESEGRRFVRRFVKDMNRLNSIEYRNQR